MYIYDIIAVFFIGIGHVLLYLHFIRYQLSYFMLIALSSLFTVLLGIVVTVTGYPEFNAIMLTLFLLGLGFLQKKLSLKHNLYYTLVSMVSITLAEMVLMEAGMFLFMQSSFNLYIWTGSLIHMIVAAIILISIALLKKQIQRIAHFIVEPPFYYISYGLLVIGFTALFILTSPSTHFLAVLYEQYWQLMYIISFILFFILLLMLLIVSHLTKERMVIEQQELLDKELLDYVEKLEVLHDELASFRHDYMNVLLSLDEGVRTKDLKQIEKVYQDVIAPTSKFMNNSEWDIIRLSHIQVPEVKSVLSVKLLAAQQQKVQVNIDIPHPIEVIAMPLVHFIRVISILVDNAMEEAVQSKGKNIQLAFFEIEGSQYFIIRNSTDQKTMDLQKIYHKRQSSKKDNRGFGLFSLKQMIDKTTNATLETMLDPPFFTQKLIIKNSDQ